MIKICFKCKKEKDTSEFYRHAMMADGLLGKCKECTKTDSSKRYHDPLKKEEILQKQREYGKTQNRREKHVESVRRYRTKYPEKYKAATTLNNAVRRKKIERMPCSVCGKENAEAHHEDYSKRLSVVWLCRKHHAEIHATRPEALVHDTIKKDPTP